MRDGDTSLGGAKKAFSETLRDLISRARDASPEVRRQAVEEICKVYWKPIYFHLRQSWAKTNEDAKDLTQAFLLWLVEGDALIRYEPERASFRAYLKSLLKHFVQNHDEALHRLKRGGGGRLVDLNVDALELERVLEDRRGVDPEQLFDRAWKAELLRQAVERVGAEFRRRGQVLQFRVFEEYDGKAPAERPTYHSLAARHGLSESDIANYLFAVREAIRAEIRSELGKITEGPKELDEEWNAFFTL